MEPMTPLEPLPPNMMFPFTEYATILCEAQLAGDPSPAVEAMQPWIRYLSRYLFKKNKNIIRRTMSGYYVDAEDLEQEFWRRFLDRWMKIVPQDRLLYQSVQWIFGEILQMWRKSWLPPESLPTHAPVSLHQLTDFYDKGWS